MMCSCSQVAKEAVALTAKKKEAMDEEQRRVEERHREELRQHQEDLAKQQKLLREQEATREAAVAVEAAPATALGRLRRGGQRGGRGQVVEPAGGAGRRRGHPRPGDLVVVLQDCCGRRGGVGLGRFP